MLKFKRKFRRLKVKRFIEVVNLHTIGILTQSLVNLLKNPIKENKWISNFVYYQYKTSIVSRITTLNVVPSLSFVVFQGSLFTHRRFKTNSERHSNDILRYLKRRYIYIYIYIYIHTHPCLIQIILALTRLWRHS